MKNLASVIGRTWLDEELTNETSIPDTGYGAEARNALIARRQFLMQQGILENENTALTQSHLDALEKRDLTEATKKLSAQLGNPNSPAMTLRSVVSSRSALEFSTLTCVASFLVFCSSLETFQCREPAII